jgi:hypothetical protein
MSTWLFTLAAATGSVALAVIFGVEHLPAAALIFVSAGTARASLQPPFRCTINSPSSRSFNSAKVGGCIPAADGTPLGEAEDLEDERSTQLRRGRGLPRRGTSYKCSED